MNNKIRLSDILIDSIYLAADDDPSILSDDSRLKDVQFKKRISAAVEEIEKLIGQKKREYGLGRIVRIEMVIKHLSEIGKEKANAFLHEFIPGVDRSAVLQFYRKLEDPRSGSPLDEDSLYIRIIENIDNIEISK